MTCRPWEAVRARDALIEELRDRCARLESEGFLLRERLIRAEEAEQVMDGTAAPAAASEGAAGCRQQEKATDLWAELSAMATHAAEDSPGEPAPLRSESGCAVPALAGRGEPQMCGDGPPEMLPVVRLSTHSSSPTFGEASDCASVSCCSSVPPSPSSLRRLESGVLVDVPQASRLQPVAFPGIQCSTDAMCPQGHRLQLLSTATVDSLGWICDGCEARYKPTARAQRHRCIQCDYDLCEGCIHQGCHVPLGSSVTCARGHVLQPLQAVAHDSSRQWVCDGCRRSCEDLIGTTFHRCARCDYDLCDACQHNAFGVGALSAQACAPSGLGGAEGAVIAGPSQLAVPSCPGVLVGVPGIDRAASVELRTAPDPGEGFSTPHFAASVGMIAPDGSGALQRGRQLPWDEAGVRRGRSVDARPDSSTCAPPGCSSSSTRRSSSLGSLQSNHELTSSLAQGVETACRKLPSLAPPVLPPGVQRCPQAGVGLVHTHHRRHSVGAVPQGTQAAALEQQPRKRLASFAAAAPLHSLQPCLHASRMSPNPVVTTNANRAQDAALSLSPAVGGSDVRLHAGPTRCVPATREAFLFLHNSVAMPLMRRTADLGRAYQVLDEANALHVRLHGIPSGEAVYNMACCLSLAAAALSSPAQSAGAFDVSPGLPPLQGSMSPTELAEARLDLSAAMLEAAVELGYGDMAHMAADADLAATRERRPWRFAAALQRALALRSRQGHGPGSRVCLTLEQAAPDVRGPLPHAEYPHVAPQVPPLAVWAQAPMIA